MNVDSGEKLSYDSNVNDCKMCKIKTAEQTPEAQATDHRVLSR